MGRELEGIIDLRWMGQETTQVRGSRLRANAKPRKIIRPGQKAHATKDVENAKRCVLDCTCDSEGSWLT